MRPAKGHIALIDAMRSLMAGRPNLHLVFVGSGSPTFERVQAYIAELGLQSRIHLMGTRRDVPNLLAGFDLFALATEQEASGTVYVEAQASGLPVVGTGRGRCFRKCSATASASFLVPPRTRRRLRTRCSVSSTIRRCANRWARPAAT